MIEPVFKNEKRIIKVKAALLIFLVSVSPVCGHAATQHKNARKSVPSVPKDRISTGKSTTIAPVRIRSPLLVEILNHASVQDLNSESGERDQQLHLRLYSVPKEGDCIQDSHYVCSHHYYLAVSTYEEGLGEAAYDLGEVGEISDIQWSRPDDQLSARLRITVSNYPKEYFKHNQTLIKREKRYELKITLERLSVTPTK
jgi:hypothetical protein